MRVLRPRLGPRPGDGDRDSLIDDGALPATLPPRDLVTILGNLVDNAVGVTAPRYLEHLVTLGSAVRSPQYGQIGRPELHYRRVAPGR